VGRGAATPHTPAAPEAGELPEEDPLVVELMDMDDDAAPPKEAAGTVEGSAAARVSGADAAFAVLLTALRQWWPLLLRPAHHPADGTKTVETVDFSWYTAHGARGDARWVLSHALGELPRCGTAAQLAALLRRCLPALCTGDGGAAKGCYTPRRSLVATTPCCSRSHAMVLRHETHAAYAHGVDSSRSWICDACDAKSRHMYDQQRWCCVDCVEDICKQCWAVSAVQQRNASQALA